MAYLIDLNEELEPYLLPGTADTSPVTVGRDEPANIVVGDPVISASHLSIYIKDDLYIVRDHSSNGTKINGNTLSRAPQILKNGDVISLPNGSRFRFSYELEPVTQKAVLGW